MNEPGARPVRLVLDTSAVAAWVRESLAVGELLAEVDDEHGAVIVPLACLIEVAHVTPHPERLDLLIAHPAVFLLSDDPADWRPLAATRTIVGRADLASAAWFSLDLGVDVMTREARWYAGVAGGRRVLEFDDDQPGR